MLESPLELSVFDRSDPAAARSLARAAESFGYKRFWVSEHRYATSSASPTVLAAVAASSTDRIRVGTAGIMLRYLSPLRVAEDFSLLELLFPQRIDLGTINGWEGDA